MIDHSNPSGAEHREVRERIRYSQSVRAVIASRGFPVDKEHVWSALTEAEHLAGWFLPVSGELKLKGRFKFENNAECLVLECIAFKEIEISWNFGEQSSWVTLHLTEGSDGTRLTLEHVAPKGPTTEEHWAQYGPGAAGVGWDLSFFALGLYLDGGGQAIDRDANMAWMTTEPGKAFIRTCADAWRQAHVTAGENPDVASAMATNTANFYTGE